LLPEATVGDDGDVIAVTVPRWATAEATPALPASGSLTGAFVIVRDLPAGAAMLLAPLAVGGVVS
jgi:hypothetical protein